eukprot:CAMPEP_0176364982 /NCGR_PEP_ID=MMETSP0126-20121128/20156_1 /TAXON_ID=141414 ORGANISM="Strombidinopsis acuminatum, Strain SPMC142" /NCGR_SAMPLE_ID=MMETSP0126 /ASSEMBLY_ACC=CAM_ASM_000229 /LENGTH=111 /DNA_ID=CAMNT_0017721811 /DNA_START=95 /DNA_END=430 /DNA_ORIENTATION=+
MMQQPMMQQPMMAMPMTKSPEYEHAKSQYKKLKNLKNSSTSTKVDCPYCEKEVETKVRENMSMCQYASCLGIYFVGCSAGCCLIPFCMREFKDFTHKCPHCDKTLGKMTKC